MVLFVEPDTYCGMVTCYCLHIPSDIVYWPYILPLAWMPYHVDLKVGSVYLVYINLHVYPYILTTVYNTHQHLDFLYTKKLFLVSYLIIILSVWVRKLITPNTRFR